MNAWVTTVLDALGLMALAVGVGLAVLSQVDGLLGVAAGCVTGGLVVLAGSALAQGPILRAKRTRKKEDGYGSVS